MKKTAWTAATLAAAVIGLAGCTDPDTPNTTSSTTTTVTTSSSTTTSASPTTSPEDAAALQAETVYRAYLRAQTTCLADPRKTKPTCFDAVAIGTALNTMRQALRAAQEVDSKVSGDVTIVSIKTTKVDLTNKINETPPTVPQVVFRVCEDVSKYNIVDKDGKSIVPPSRKPHVLLDVSVLNYKLSDPSQWRVGLETEVKGQSC